MKVDGVVNILCSGELKVSGKSVFNPDGSAYDVEIKIFNIAGELVNSEELASSSWKIINDKYCYEYEWKVSNIASGVYIYFVKAEKFGEKPIKILKKLAVIK